jgi:hypothetical protein
MVAGENVPDPGHTYHAGCVRGGHTVLIGAQMDFIAPGKFSTQKASEIPYNPAERLPF